MSLIIFILWFSLLLNRLDYPTFSFDEVKYAPEFFLYNVSPEYWWTLRIVGVCIMAIVVYQLIKKYKLSTFSQLLLLSSPWLFIVSREYNPLVDVLLLANLLIFNSQIPLLGALVHLIIMYKLSVLREPSWSFIQEKIDNLWNYFRFQSIFLAMETNSAYLQIPKNGYFSLLSLPFFVYGLYKLIDYRNIFFFSMGSILFYFLYPTNHFILAGAGILFIVQVIIIQKSNALVTSVPIKIVLVIAIIISYLFFLEMYFRHYQKKYGGERGYNEIKLVEKLTNKAFKKVYLPDNDSIKLLIRYYSKNKTIAPIEYIRGESELKKMVKDCPSKEVFCVLNEQQLPYFKLTTNSQQLEKLTNPAGLTIYYIY